MAKFEMQLPKDVLADLRKIYENSDKIFGDMTKAGAEVVYFNIQGTVPTTIRESEMMKCLKITKVYNTPSDGGINCKVGFYGYFYNRWKVRTPAPLVANMFEYGSSKMGKQPFFRKAFKKSQIEKAMLQAQNYGSGGLLSDE